MDNMIGARVAWEDMCNNRRGVVYATNAASKGHYVIGAGGLSPLGPTVDVVWEDGLVTKGCAMDRWRLLPGVASAQEIADLLANVESTRTRKDAEKKAAAAEDANIRAALPTTYPHLVTVASKPEWATGRVAAENIRRMLSAAFPGVRFSVRYKSFSGGNSIDVDWVDGPTRKSVDAIADRFQYGDFDGMTDSYDYRTDRPFRDVFGSAKYVMCQRQCTLDGVRRAWAAKGYSPDDVPASWETDGAWGHPLREHIASAWSETAL